MVLLLTREKICQKNEDFIERPFDREERFKVNQFEDIRKIRKTKEEESRSSRP